MIGRWSADLIEASGQAPRAQAESMAAAKTPAKAFEKALAKREASMDGPSGAGVERKRVNLRLTYRGAGVLSGVAAALAFGPIAARSTGQP
jgi:hypothetical protein